MGTLGIGAVAAAGLLPQAKAANAEIPHNHCAGTFRHFTGQHCIRGSWVRSYDNLCVVCAYKCTTYNEILFVAC